MPVNPFRDEIAKINSFLMHHYPEEYDKNDGESTADKVIRLLYKEEPPVPYVWNKDYSVYTVKQGAYWERNMLALWFANYVNGIWERFKELTGGLSLFFPDMENICGWYRHEGEGFEGWSRVISLFNGKYTFHVPDDFDLGDLPEIKPNWDGHTTEEKWFKIMEECGVLPTVVLYVEGKGYYVNRDLFSNEVVFSNVLQKAGTFSYFNSALEVYNRLKSEGYEPVIKIREWAEDDE